MNIYLDSYLKIPNFNDMIIFHWWHHFVIVYAFVFRFAGTMFSLDGGVSVCWKRFSIRCFCGFTVDIINGMYFGDIKRKKKKKTGGRHRYQKLINDFTLYFNGKFKKTWNGLFWEKPGTYRILLIRVYTS